MVKYLSVAELAEQAAIPNSTCRRYLTAFEAFFIEKGGGRVKKYEVGAVAILKRIKQLYDEGLDTHEIHSVLANEFPMVIDGEKSEEQEAVSGLATGEDVASIEKRMQKLEDLNAELIQRMQEQHLFYEKKFEELKHDRDFLHSLKDGMEQRRLESASHESQTKEQLKDIEKQLSELRQNEKVQVLTEQIMNLSQQFEQVIKETAADQEKKKGFWARLFK